MNTIVVIGIVAFIIGVILMRLLLPRWLRSYDRKIAEHIEATRATEERLNEVTQTITQRIEDVENQAREAWSSEIDGLTKRIDEADKASAKKIEVGNLQVDNKVSEIEEKLVEMINNKLQEAQADNEKKLEENLGQITQKLSEMADQESSQLSEKIVEIESAAEKEIASLQQTTRAVQSQTEEIHSQINAVEARLAELEGDVKNTFRSLDSNVTSVLTEMKNELLKGVSRVESIEGIVASRAEAESAFLGSEASANE